MRTMIGYLSCSVTMYSDGTNGLMWFSIDQASRRIIPHDLGTVEQPAKFPFTPSELLVMAALDAWEVHQPAEEE